MASIAVENINHAGKTTAVDGARFEAMRKAVLKVLPAKAPGISIAELEQAVLGHLPDDLFPAGAKAGWWTKTVQRDLEAKRVIVRTRTGPLRLHRS